MPFWSLWLIIAIVFLSFELFSQSIWTLCIAIGSLGAMACSLLGLELSWQGLCFVGLTIIAYIGLLPMLKRIYTRNIVNITTGMDALIGRKTFLIEPISPGHLGRVKIDGDNWQVDCDDKESNIPVGTEVKVVSYKSIILTVEVCGK